MWEDIDEDLANNEDKKKRGFSVKSARNFEDLYSSEEEEDSSELEEDSDIDYSEEEGQG